MKTLLYILVLIAVHGSAFAGSDSLYVITQGDSAVIWNKNVPANCASKFGFDVSFKTDTIVIVEKDTVGPIALCICRFDLSVTTVNKFGNFVAMVYRQQLKKYFYPEDTTYFVGSVSFSVTHPNMLPYYFIRSFQSKCISGPVAVEQNSTTLPEVNRIVNHPNPFNSTTNFRFVVPGSQFVSLKLFDVLGREVAALLNSDWGAGEHTVQWNAAGFPSGMYIYRMTIGNVVQVGKMSYVK